MSNDRALYRVQYVAGPYNGHRDVWAEDADHACAIVRAEVNRSMTLPMYAESYRATLIAEAP